MYSTAGAASASPDQMFRPLTLTVSFVHAIVASRAISVGHVEGGYVQNMRAAGGKVCTRPCCTNDVQLLGDVSAWRLSSASSCHSLENTVPNFSPTQFIPISRPEP